MFNSESVRNLNITSPYIPEQPSYGNIIVTGSAATGKTYFSRLVALNAILRGENVVVCEKEENSDNLETFAGSISLNKVRYTQADPKTFNQFLKHTLADNPPHLMILDEVYKYGTSKEVDQTLAIIPTSSSEKPRLLFITQDEGQFRRSNAGLKFYSGFETKIHFTDMGVCEVDRGPRRWNAISVSNPLEHEILSDERQIRRGFHGRAISSFANIDSTLPNLVITERK